MQFDQPLIRGRLVRRYKRFLADVELEDGRLVTAHCPNPGAMLGITTPGLEVWLEPAANPKRKLQFSWRLVALPEGLTGVDTNVPNKVVGEALRARAVAPLAAYETVRPEQKYGKNSRIDFLLTGDGLPDAYVEVKNVHLLREDDWAEFPDCVTTRGAKHLDELGDMVDAGHRAVMLYLIQRAGCARLKFAADLDPAYAAAFVKARSRGVEALAYTTHITTSGVSLGVPVPVR